MCHLAYYILFMLTDFTHAKKDCWKAVQKQKQEHPLSKVGESEIVNVPLKYVTDVSMPIS